MSFLASVGPLAGAIHGTNAASCGAVHGTVIGAFLGVAFCEQAWRAISTRIPPARRLFLAGYIRSPAVEGGSVFAWRYDAHARATCRLGSAATATSGRLETPFSS